MSDDNLDDLLHELRAALDAADGLDDDDRSRLADIVAETVPGCEVEIAEGAGPDKRSYRVDCSKIENELPGFEAQWDARKGAQELYDAFREYGMDEEKFQGPLYVRLKHLQSLIDSGRMSQDLRWKR